MGIRKGLGFYVGRITRFIHFSSDWFKPFMGDPVKVEANVKSTRSGAQAQRKKPIPVRIPRHPMDAISRLSEHVTPPDPDWERGELSLQALVNVISRTYADFGAHISAHVPWSTFHGFMHGFGFDTRDLYSLIRVTGRSAVDFRCIFFTVVPVELDLGAFTKPVHFSDINSVISLIPPKNLYGYLQPVTPDDIDGHIVSVRPSIMPAYCGGHYPQHLTAYAKVNPAIDFLVLIRAAEASLSALEANLACRGGYKHLYSLLMPYQRSREALEATLTVKGLRLLSAYLRGWFDASLPSYVYSQPCKDLGAHLNPYVIGAIAEFKTLLWGVDSSAASFPSYIKGIYSVHTTGYAPNHHLHRRPLHTIKVVTRGGVLKFKPMVVWGDLPDLTAYIYAAHRPMPHLITYIVGMIPKHSDLDTYTEPLTRKVVRRRLSIAFDNIFSLGGFLNISSGYRTLEVFITGRASTSTNTHPDSYWVFSKMLYTPIVSTTKGIAIMRGTYARQVSRVFMNLSNIPDLAAYIHSWKWESLGASIFPGPSEHLYGYLNAKGYDTLAYLAAFVHSYATYDILGILTCRGSCLELGAEATASGSNRILRGRIFPNYAAGGMVFIGVSTNPFTDLFCSINYSTISGRRFGSGTGHLFSQVYPWMMSEAELGATLNSRTFTLHLQGKIQPIDKVKTRILRFMYRKAAREFISVRTYLFGFGQTSSSLSCTIIPEWFKSDLGGEIMAMRYPFGFIEKPAPIEVYKIVKSSGFLLRELHLRFGSVIPGYVYDSISNALYKNGGRKWTIDIVSLLSEEKFFDKVSSKTVRVDSLSEYTSIDEAIRYAIDIASIGHYQTLGAEIASQGGFSALTSTLVPVQL